MFESCFFFHFKNAVSGVQSGQKILKIISDVPLSMTDHLSHITFHSVDWDSLSHLSYKSRSVKITFFQLLTSFLEEGMIKKFQTKFQMFLLIASIDGVSWQKFSLKLSQMKRIYDKNCKNLKP